MAGKLAFLGGSFDPVHHGHLITAMTLAEKGPFDRVTFVPASSPPHKAPAAASPADRLAMLQLAVAGSDVLDVWDWELSQAGPSYTVRTLAELRRVHGRRARLSWVVGADMLEDLSTWHRVGELFELADLVVALRPPWDERIDEMLSSLAGRLGEQIVARLREAVLTTPLIDISSGDIRRRVSGGLDIRYLVPECVREYVREHELYGVGRPAER